MALEDSVLISDSFSNNPFVSSKCDLFYAFFFAENPLVWLNKTV